MRDAPRLTKSCDFQNVYRNGRVVYNRYIALHILEREDEGCNRAGFVAGKKIGPATARNRIKRLLKEAYRANEEKTKKAYDTIFVARKSLKEKSYLETEAALRGVLKRAGLLEDQ